MPRWPASLLIGIALLWLLALALAPLALTNGFASVALLVYETAARLCHQRADRSFHLAGVQLPVCARCLGLYASGACGALVAIAARTEIPGPRRLRVLLAFASLPTILSVGGEWLGLVHPSGIARALLAAPLGAAAGWVVVGLLESAAANRNAQADALSCKDVESSEIAG